MSDTCSQFHRNGSHAIPICTPLFHHRTPYAHCAGKCLGSAAHLSRHQGVCPDTPGALVPGQAEPRRVPSHNQEEGNSTRTAVRIAVPGSCTSLESRSCLRKCSPSFSKKAGVSSPGTTADRFHPCAGQDPRHEARAMRVGNDARSTGQPCDCCSRLAACP